MLRKYVPIVDYDSCLSVMYSQVLKWKILKEDFSVPGGELGM